MTLIVPNVAEQQILTLIFARTLSCHLYSNNKTPAETDTLGSYTEVVGGGYASKSLITALWTITQANPSYGTYNLPLDFRFTGVTNAPGTIYGYYIKDSTGILWIAERFPASVLPYSPVKGSLFRFTPRLECA